MTFNRYLTKYENLYQTYRNEDNIISIKCKYGLIQPFSIEKRFLLYAGTFHSVRKKNAFMKLKPSFCGINQEAETDITLTFPESKLAELSKYFAIYKRRRLSDETRKRLQEQAKRMNALKE